VQTARRKHGKIDRKWHPQRKVSKRWYIFNGVPETIEELKMAWKSKRNEKIRQPKEL